jgi:hypothetical protein
VRSKGRRSAATKTDKVAVELPGQVKPLPSQVTKNKCATDKDNTVGWLRWQRACLLRQFSGFELVLRIRESAAFLTPGSGMEKNRIRD